MNTSVILQNQSHNAEISLHGAELIFYGNKISGNMLWSKQTDHWNRVAPNLFPIVGRLLGDSYSIGGKTYAMSQHGFARDNAFEVVEKSDTIARLRLISLPKSMDVYPYFFVFEVCYVLTENGIVVSYETQNTGKEPMYYSVGGHPAFYLEESLENYYLEFDVEVPLNRQELEGSYFSGKTIHYGVSDRLPLNDELFEKDAFVLKAPGFSSVSLKHRSGKTLVRMKCDSWIAIGFWTKKGAPFICIEPWWGWADDVHATRKLEEKAGIRQLNPGEKERLEYSIENG
ncbi:aldose 1-epimerase family protein [Fluviicola sp.]|uniref:aldose 1-epimerase family protein n=1 Tax=Fluviicola sp. TaxID=1917219 RepID=UPI0031D2D401